MKKVLLIVISLAFSALVMNFIIKLFTKTELSMNILKASLCDNEKDGEDEHFSGIVINKYIDYENHAYKTIKFTSNEKVNESILFVLDKSSAYDFIAEGDSIAKNKGDLMVRVYRDFTLREFKLDYGCEH